MHLLLRTAIAVAVAVVLATNAEGLSGDGARGQAASGVARLLASNEVPAVPSTAAGVGVVSWDGASRLLTYSVVTNVTSAVTGIHIHQPAAGTKLFLSTSGWGVAGPLDPEWGDAILSGLTYFNVHTLDFPDGEVRGDILTPASTLPPNTLVYAAVADPVFEVQRVPAALDASSRAVGIVTFNTVSGDAFVEVATARDDVSSVHIHNAAFGVNGGPPDCDLGAAHSGVCTGLVQGTFDAGAYYFNFHVGTPGYMRGQIYPLSTTAVPAAVSMAGALAPAAAGPFAGVATAWYNPVTGMLAYSIAHNVTVPSGALLGTQVLCVGPLACASPITGTLGPLNATTIPLVFGPTGIAIVVSTGASVAAQGSLAYAGLGAPTYTVNYAATLSYFGAHGTPEPAPPVASGQAYLTLVSGTVYRYTVAYTTNATSVTLVVGRGSTGADLAAYSVVNTGAGSGVLVGLIDIAALSITVGQLDGSVFFALRTPAFPAADGAARGQLATLRRAALPAATHIAVLDKSQEVTPSFSAGTGLAVARFNPLTFTVDYRVTWENVGSTVDAVHLHMGPRGANGPKLFDLALSPATNGIEGTTPVLTAAQGAAFVAGGMYFNVHTTAYPSGAIRGQIESPPFTYAAWPQPWDNIGTPANPVATGPALAVLHAEYEEEAPLASFAFAAAGTGSVNSVTVNAVADENAVAATLDTLCSGAGGCDSLVSLSNVAVSTVAAVAARSSLAYAQLSSAAAPTWRAPLTALAPPVGPSVAPTALSWMVALDGANEVPPVTTPHSGLASLRWDAAESTLYYSMWHDVDDADKVHLHQASGGTALYVLASDAAGAASPVTGSVVIAPEHICMLTSGTMYINIHSVTFTTGELRGNIMASQYNYASFAGSGGEEVPPVASARAGVVAVAYDATAVDVTVRVVHNIGYDITKVHIHNGPPGANGPLAIDVGTLSGNLLSPVVLASHPISGAHAAAFGAGNMYLNLHSHAFPNGEARAQVVPVTPPPSSCPSPPPPPSPAVSPPPTAPASPPPPPATSGTPAASPKTDDGVFKEDNYILAGVAFGALLCGILISAIICKACCGGKKAAKSSYDLGGASALMTI